ncbi:aldo/keto reductase [Anabaena cylindrica FACHB-243]|uniref:Pyridoxine 4-dehydrogenase n=1 Tax=Anabaena cylindrica (strain ATCC 27899 / PCC 7122) TaxID=272123 RepID=K9ZM16_ANACC|nr:MULTISPECIES: aldo/keto reductase [Anabaena]AFZ60226.1 Pyridoxine 4-dehydrogenase [Anabaena cylindrica PCC 7122]MBD2417721.1 aldo/keto reductase [Anabaena cylindrica FACHB-243]MBY5281298.1 aldo/keto reductase [Anabaena sp. CCAP 1446/1C]MBY5306889.1 aldo/keto reductase [Anabaena sp. CCAP 1446/1C]MCM2404636.1 aldo/keto reductase [Anabaena sp. CCAP 1446/1C]
MEPITLGQNGVTVPRLCIGTWAWGDQLFWNYGNGYGEEQLQAAFTAALDAGVTFFDTAEVYGFGLSEEFLGKFMKQVSQPVQIATKFGPLPWRWDGKSVSEALTASLKRLQVERIELYQVHWPFTFFLSQETLMNTLADEVKQGRIGAVGVSNYSASQMREAHQILAARGVPLAVNQVRYSLLTRQIETNGILQTARELNVIILAYSPLAQGLLTGKYTPSQNPTGARSIDPRFSQDGLNKIAPVLSLLRKIGEKYDRTPAQVALNWLIAQGNVIPIAGVKNAEQVKQNVGALGWKMTDDEFGELDRITRL